MNDLLIILKSEPAYRLKQINKALYQDLIEDWSKVTTLPFSLRKTLIEKAPLIINHELFYAINKNTVKALITLNDGLKIETVLMRHKDRNTVCVSSMVGCPLNCSFCATGKMGFTRNLIAEEIVDQVLLFARILKKENQRITNIVYMGMGEPFLNYSGVLKSIRILNDPQKFAFGARRISVSTIGVYQKIRDFTKENLEVNLAISLHAANDKLRTKIMPANIAYPLVKIMDAVEKYVDKTRRKVMFEYILIGDINDSEKDAQELSQLLDHPLYHLNLIPYNPTGVYKPSTKEKSEVFKRILKDNKIPFTQRFRFGDEINASCGQLIYLSQPSRLL